jgi:hypothetical protein
VEKYCKAGQATDGSKVNAHCMLYTYGNKYSRYSGCVTLIYFPLQQWLHKSAWMLRFTYIARLVKYDFGSFSYRVLTFYSLAVISRTTRFNIQQFYMVLTLRLIILYGLLPYTSLTDKFCITEV